MERQSLGEGRTRDVRDSTALSGRYYQVRSRKLFGSVWQANIVIAAWQVLQEN
jgi:hypothetical protein